MDAWDRVWDLAGRQDDVVTTLQVVGCGVPARTFTDCARRFRWPQPHRGVWVLHAGRVPYRGQLRAALLAGGTEAALTGVSTLWLAEAVRGTPRRVDLWLPPGRGPRPSDPAHVTRGALTEADGLRSLAGYPSLSCERAVTDLAAGASIHELVGVIVALDRLRLATYGGIRAFAEQRGRFPGVAKLRAAIAMVEGDLNHSRSEANGRQLLRDAGLHPSSGPYELRIDGVPVAEIDVAFPRWCYGVEIDGPHHLLPEVARADKARDRMLHGYGWWIDRFTTDDVDRTPQAFVAAVRRGLAQARARA